MKRLLMLLTITATACTSAVRPVLTSPDQKIWLVKGVDEIYRCADAGAADQPPNPVCIRARIVEGTK
jgi:hypothetical protein